MNDKMRVLASWIAAFTALSAQAAPPDEGFVTTPDDVKLFYRVAGEGDLVVLLPGGMYLFDDFRRLAAGRKLIAYDQRNRGRSEAVTERAKLERGVAQDADDLEAVRRRFGAERVGIVTHSYMGLAAVLYAMNHPERVSRVVQIGPPPPVFGKRYEPDVNSSDPTLRQVFARVAAVQSESASLAPVERCTRVWEVLGRLYVAKPENAHMASRWGACELPNERGAMQHYTSHILPSMKTLTFAPEQLARIAAPVLTIHGVQDRNAPYGGGSEWAALLPNARLLTISGAAHAPWIEAPDVVFAAIDRFLNGEWPAEALAPSEGRKAHSP